MKFKELRKYLFELLPDTTSFEGDNDGVEVCFDDYAEHSRILTALDFTMETLEYAADNGYDCIVTHHPMLYYPLRKLDVGGRLNARKAVFAATHKINCISVHTRFDCADGGVNDCFLKAMGLDSEMSVRFGTKEAAGAGKLAVLPEETELGDFLCGIRTAFADYYCDNFKGADIKARISYVKGTKPVKTIAAVGGSGFDFVHAAAQNGADTFITGEGTYHKILDACEEFGLNIITLGHFETEIIALPSLKEKIYSRFALPVEIYIDSKIKTF